MCNICLNICTCVSGEWKLLTNLYFLFQKGDAFRALFRVNAYNKLEVCYIIFE